MIVVCIDSVITRDEICKGAVGRVNGGSVAATAGHQAIRERAPESPIRAIRVDNSIRPMQTYTICKIKN